MLPPIGICSNGRKSSFLLPSHMDHQEFMRSLRHVPNHPDYEVQARAYKNTHGVDQMIFLHKCYWEYVDWLEARGDIDFAEWVIHCENNPFEDFTLSHLLMYWLWNDACERFKQDLPTMQPCPPMGYEGWADEYHAKKDGKTQ